MHLPRYQRYECSSTKWHHVQILNLWRKSNPYCSVCACGVQIGHIGYVIALFLPREDVCLLLMDIAGCKRGRAGEKDTSPISLPNYIISFFFILCVPVLSVSYHVIMGADKQETRLFFVAPPMYVPSVFFYVHEPITAFSLSTPCDELK